ncbi:MAG: hypothetical protein KH459_11980 [Oscillospiraceae bacterium]|nr:hypothetical protein [Oscillospiraceae bacterium]
MLVAFSTTSPCACVTEQVRPELVRNPERPPRPRLGGAALRAERGGLQPRNSNVS